MSALIDKAIKRTFNANQASWYVILLDSSKSNISRQTERIQFIISKFSLFNGPVRLLELFVHNKDKSILFLLTDEVRLVYGIRDEFFTSTVAQPDLSNFVSFKEKPNRMIKYLTQKKIQ